jgi:serine/threonine protein kinase
MLGVSEGPDGHGWLVQELLPLGSLDKHLESLYDRGKTLPPRDCLLILNQVTEALIALHGQGIIHRDLAARNVLIASLVPLRVKVTNIGLAKSSINQMSYGTQGSTLPFRLSAPEVFARIKFSVKSDVFALGVLAWELFTTGMIPWGGTADKDSVSAAVQRGERLSRDKFPDPVFERLIAPMWAESLADRPEPSAVLQIIDALLPLFPSSGQHQAEWECPVCMLPRELKSTLDACGHIFCDDCAFEASRRARCHTCNKPYAGHRRVFFR